jgi:hypothetical protein
LFTAIDCRADQAYTAGDDEEDTIRESTFLEDSVASPHTSQVAHRIQAAALRRGQLS